MCIYHFVLVALHLQLQINDNRVGWWNRGHRIVERALYYTENTIISYLISGCLVCLFDDYFLILIIQFANKTEQFTKLSLKYTVVDIC